MKLGLPKSSQHDSAQAVCCVAINSVLKGTVPLIQSFKNFKKRQAW